MFAETESGALTSALRSYVEADAAMASSSLAWVEVSRAVRAYADADVIVAYDQRLTEAAAAHRSKVLSPTG